MLCAPHCDLFFGKVCLLVMVSSLVGDRLVAHVKPFFWGGSFLHSTHQFLWNGYKSICLINSPVLFASLLLQVYIIPYCHPFWYFYYICQVGWLLCVL